MTIALITGGSRGIGAATAVGFAEAGWNVAIGYKSDTDAAAAVVDRCEANGVKAIAVQADVSDDDGVRAMFETVDRELGTLTALVNSAGIVVAPHQRVDAITVDRLQQVFAVNVIGSFLCAREAVLRMSQQHGGTGGSIVNISSVAARIGSPGEYVDYAASKGAIDTMTLGLAKEVATEGSESTPFAPESFVPRFTRQAETPDERTASPVPFQCNARENRKRSRAPSSGFAATTPAI